MTPNGQGPANDLSASAISDIAKTGGIFPLLSVIPAFIAAESPAVAKAAALDAVGTAAWMALKKATGETSQKEKGLRLPGTPHSLYGKGLTIPGTHC